MIAILDDNGTSADASKFHNVGQGVQKRAPIDRFVEQIFDDQDRIASSEVDPNRWTVFGVG